MTISRSEAEATAEALGAASKAPGLLRQIRWELDHRADEFRRAIQHYDDVVTGGGEPVIEMCQSVSRGMMVAHDRFGWCRVIRKLNDGLSLHLESPDGPGGFYRNFSDPTSPVVVKA